MWPNPQETENRKLRILSHLLKNSLMENFVFCAVWYKLISHNMVISCFHTKRGTSTDVSSIHWVKSVRIWSFSGPYFPEIRTRKTLNTDIFHAVTETNFFLSSTSMLSWTLRYLSGVMHLRYLIVNEDRCN